MNRGKYSEWLKIDLHIHTDWSKKTKENDYKGVFSVDTLHEKLTENEVKIFSLTDHNIINVDAYEEYYENYNSDDDPLLLVGVELDIEINERTYHSLLIFNYSDIENAKSISNRLEIKYQSKNINDKVRILSIDEIVELFLDDDFFFIPHAGNTKSIVSGYRGNIQDAQKMVLLMQSALEKVKEKAKQKYNDGFNKVLQNAFKSKDDMPYINFSDNHNISRYPYTHKGENGSKNHEFYYVKGSKSYETLRLAFIDPKSRIKSTEEYNKINHHNNIIEKLKIEADDVLNNYELEFSPHLNVIIGGRSSGKSLLMNLFSKKIDKLKSNNKYDKIIDDAEILIKSKDDSEYKSTTSITSDLIYINQGDIVNYFEDNKLEDLSKNAEKSEEYIQAKKVFSENKYQMLSLITELNNSYKNAYEIGENKRYVLHKSTIDKILSKEFILKLDYEKLKVEFDKSSNLNESKALIEALKSNLKDLDKMELLAFSEEEEEIIARFKDLIENKLILIETKTEKNTKKLNFINAIYEKITTANDSLNQNAQQKTSAQVILKQLKGDVKDTFIKMRDLKIKSQKLEKFDYSLKQEIVLNEQTKLVLEVEKQYELKEIILEGINQSDTQKSIYLNLLDLLKGNIRIKRYTDNQPDTLDKKIKSLIKDLKNCLDNPKDYLNYKDGSNSKNNSPGFNSEKYLEIILQNPTIDIIFIDQPEDNLGNRFIAEKLVDIFRHIKFHKQIFLVTHNPAIVVYGDAECIILAENNENKISYKQIVLEDTHAQKEICGILDGGEYIFDNRSKKYNIHRILNEKGA